MHKLKSTCKVNRLSYKMINRPGKHTVSTVHHTCMCSCIEVFFA